MQKLRKLTALHLTDEHEIYNVVICRYIKILYTCTLIYNLNLELFYE